MRFTLAAAFSTRRRARPIRFDKARKAITHGIDRSTDAVYFRVFGQRQREALRVDAGVERDGSIAHGTGRVAVARREVEAGELAVAAALESDRGLRPAAADRDLADHARLEVQPDALTVVTADEDDRRAQLVGRLDLRHAQVLGRGGAAREERDEILGLDGQAQQVSGRLDVRGAHPGLVRRRVVRGDPTVVDGDEQERLAERRQRLEPDRRRSAGEEDAAQPLPVTAPLESDVGEGAQVVELLPARGEPVDHASGLRLDGRAWRGWRDRATGEEEEGEGATERLWSARPAHGGAATSRPGPSA